MPTVMRTILSSITRRQVLAQTDGQLLSDFMRDHAEWAFAELMHRHGAMVFSMAQRLLGSAVDAEDVYQASFLLLARKASSLRQKRSVAGWLYCVTRRLSADLRKQQRRRNNREEIASRKRSECIDSHISGQFLETQEILHLLDAELARLSKLLREPLVLHCLEGLSHQQVAERLGLAIGTVASRLNRAKNLLKVRLMKRGIGAAIILVLWSGVAQARIHTTPLAFAAAKAALNQSTSLIPFVSSKAITLFTGELHMIWLSQIKLLAGSAMAAVGLTLFGASLLPAATSAPKMATSSMHEAYASTADEELDKLQGTWYCIAAISGGKKAPPPDVLDAMRELQLNFQGNILSIKNSPKGDVGSTVKLDATTTPKRLELLSDGRSVMHAVYTLEGDVLILTFQEGVNEFPKTLAVTKDLQGGMLVLQRVPFNHSNATPKADILKTQAAKAVAHNNMRQMGLALHMYLSDHNKFPRNYTDRNGKEILSWRVGLLPYLEQDALYKQFNLDEPWDSDHNKKLVEKMPSTFAIDDSTRKNHTTAFQCFIGNGAGFEHNKDLRVQDIIDGMSNTFMFVEAKDPVIWTKPEDLEFQPNKQLPTLGGRFGAFFQVTMFDGSVRSIPLVTKEDIIKAFITRAGGEVPALETPLGQSKPSEK